MAFLLMNFAVKNGMFNLNENNRIVMSRNPSDMRIGVNGMCGLVRAAGLEPANGDVWHKPFYVHSSGSRTLEPSASLQNSRASLFLTIQPGFAGDLSFLHAVAGKA